MTINDCRLKKKQLSFVNDIKSSIRERVLAIQAAFQIRHTLSHNQGKVTQSDRSKLVALGLDIEHGEVIDPSSDNLGKSIREFLESEAKSYTAWLLSETAKYLKSRFDAKEIELTIKLKERIEKSVGTHPDLSALTWI